MYCDVNEHNVNTVLRDILTYFFLKGIRVDIRNVNWFLKDRFFSCLNSFWVENRMYCCFWGLIMGCWNLTINGRVILVSSLYKLWVICIFMQLLHIYSVIIIFKEVNLFIASSLYSLEDDAAWPTVIMETSSGMKFMSVFGVFILHC